jgi:transposase
MESKQKGSTQATAAAKAGFSERSARRLERRCFSPAKSKRSWRTRNDPLEEVWQSELVPLLQSQPALEARTLLEELQKRHPDQYPENLLRTLQRRVRDWKAKAGPEKEVIFRQEHPPGWQSISDFTNADELGVTIRREPLHHLLYHFRLPFSGWEHAQVVLGGESYTALAEGMQNAFWAIGGVTKTHRTDSLSAAYKNCSDKAKEEFTESYRQLCECYGVEPTRNNKGISHENGSIESPNRHLKHRLDQALMVRGSKDFSTLEEYRAFLQNLLQRQNKRVEKALAEERAFLKPLPERRACDYTEERTRVTSSSTVCIRQVPYSVPSRLIGMILKVHLYDDRLECYVGGDLVITLQRIRRNKKRLRSIDYRHIVGSLTQKPQAFRNYIYREELFPTLAFHQTWERLDEQLDPRKACREYVNILNEAARPNNEKIVNDYLEECLTNNRLPKSEEVRALQGTSIQHPSLKDLSPELSNYDALLVSQGGIL